MTAACHTVRGSTRGSGTTQLAAPAAETLGETYDQPFISASGDGSGWFYHSDGAGGTSAHALSDGSGPFWFTTDGSLPSGISGSTDYYSCSAIVGLPVDTLRVALTSADAIAGTNLVDTTTDGSGSLRLKSTSRTVYLT